MCWVLYLAANRPLPLKPFDPAAPGFNVTEPAGREAAVRAQFSQPHVYALGAHTSCGCGFDRGQARPGRPEELEAIESSLDALRSFLGKALADDGTVELFACWDGDQAATPDHRWRRSLEDFHPAMAWFPDRSFVTVSRGAT